MSRCRARPAAKCWKKPSGLRPDLVTILTSAYSYESIRTTFAGLRAEHFIRKPFCVDDLMNLLQTTLVTRSSTVRAELPEIGKADSRGA